MNISERISALRNLMKAKNLQAYIIADTDPHINKYLPPHWAAREWISGFTGSAGTVVVTLNKAGLWTDSRYFLQASEQLKNTEIELFKLGLPETPNFPQWLKNQLTSDVDIGFNGECMSISIIRALKDSLADLNIHFIGEHDLIGDLWDNRPAIPQQFIFTYPTKYAGKSRNEKLKEIRREMKKMEANFHFIGSLDDIAWIFNIRGNDVEYNPIVVAYALVSEEKTALYIDETKVPVSYLKEFALDKIELVEYNHIFNDLSEIPASSTVLLDPARTNQKIYNNISANIIEKENPSQILKSCKNAIEIKNIKNAMIKDGLALIQFFYWLDKTVGNETITELSIMKKLHEFRSKQNDFISESFSSIVGYGEHGAIIHYSATPETDVKLHPRSYVLIDSGGQYLDGTTDVTRTISLGTLTKEEKIDFTLVLKGMIQLTLAKFPKGTRGCNLDLLARKSLWEYGRNYGHGTGHGIGCFLNVHEGPQSIRQELKEQAILPGMITSNEPGLYREGKYGIRHENLILCNEDEKTEFGEFLSFETLTLCHFDTRAILPELLTQKEKKWLNNYHQKVFDAISPKLDEPHKNWLKEKTKRI